MGKSISAIFFVSIFLILVWSNIAFAGKLLIDDFSSGYLNEDIWWPREYVQHIENGKYVSKLGNSTGMGAEVDSGYFRVSLPFNDSDNIHTIKTDITLNETKLDTKASNSASVALVGGAFYYVDGNEEVAGDIWAELQIGDRGNGLEAYWQVLKHMANDPTQWNYLEGGTISLTSPLQLNVPVTVKISYDGNNTIDFFVDDQSAIYIGQEMKGSDPQEPFKALRVGINAMDGSNTGYVSAAFDNVFINNSTTIYDDFSSDLIDRSNWQYNETVREIADGHLQTILRRENATSQINTYLSKKDASYFEATARIDSNTQLSDGASCIARLQGYYYNDSRGPGSGYDYNINEGDVFAQIRIQYLSDGNLNADAFVDRSDSSDESSWTNLFAHTFNLPLSLDTDYTLSIGFQNNQLIFKCNNEIAVYNITTPTYVPYGEHRLLRSRLYLDSGESGYLKTQFDNVYVGTPPLVDVITDLKILTGTPWIVDEIIPTDFDNNNKIDIADAITSLQVAGGFIQPVEHSSMNYFMQCGYPNNYAIAISGPEPFVLETVEGPNISNFWQAHETHWLVELSTGPLLGDQYSLHYRYPDETVQDDIHTITSVNTNFFFILSPSEGAVVDSDSFAITWQPAIGNVDHRSIIVTDDTGEMIWIADFNPDITSSTFNYDNSAIGTLQAGQNYWIHLHSYDEYGNQATTVSTFFYLEHPSLRYTIQNYYPENYSIAIKGYEPYTVESVSGPNIVNVWQANDTDYLVNLSVRPSVGDTYNFHYSYPDETVKDDTYTVSTINDNFSFITSPVDGSTIDTTTPTISWSAASDIERYYFSIEKQVLESESIFIWFGDAPSGTTNVVYNFDATAIEPLYSGNNYKIYIHTIDSEGHQATTVSYFSVELP